MRPQLVEVAVALERDLPRQRLEEDTGEGVDVGTAVDVAALCLLGAVRGPDARPCR